VGKTHDPTGFGLSDWRDLPGSGRRIFGGLATIYVLLTYLYLSSLALLFGIQLDACVREEASR
jgi:hypothetical protein